MAAISQMTFSNAFSWTKMYEYMKISLKFVPKGTINNIPALVQIMAWHRPGETSLRELIMVSLLMHIWVTRPQWVIPLCTNFFSRNTNMYLQFLSFLDTDMTQVVEILSHGRQGPNYFTLSMSWVLMTQEARHQQQWYWPTVKSLI